MDEDTFVSVVLEDQPARPQYFEFDAQRNRELHPLLDDSPPRLLGTDEVLALAEGGAVLLDSREIADFAAGHLRGAVNIGLQGRFAEWAGDVLSPDRDIVLVGDPTSALETKVRLARVGLDRVVGQLDGPTALLAARPELHETSSRLTLEQLAELQSRGPDIQLVDVRNQGETAQGTIVGAREIPLATLTGSLAALDRTAPVVVYCASGSRSQVASSVLREAGFADVSDLLGGYAAWEAAGLPVTAGRSLRGAASRSVVRSRSTTAGTACLCPSICWNRLLERRLLERHRPAQQRSLLRGVAANGGLLRRQGQQ